MDLSEFISTAARPILLDGAMGTQLDEAGLEMGGQNNLTHPQAVQAVHERYVACGVDLLITNTFTMNRIYIEAHNLDVDARQVNLAGANLAREAARQAQSGLQDGLPYVIGDLTSTSKMLQPYGDLTEQAAVKAYEEQAGYLAEGGVDGYIIETMFDLQEALCALRGCQAGADLPVMVSMAFNPAKNGARTIMGNTPQECAQALSEAGAHVIGANCGSLDPFQVAEVVAEMKSASDLPILAQPNAGKPKMVAGRTEFDMSPAEFARGIQACIQAGARLVGGCCGTTPAHIQAVVDLVRR